MAHQVLRDPVSPAQRPKHVDQGDCVVTRHTKTTLFKPPAPRAETLMDKTTRVVREIQKEETAKSDTKTARLRKARLEREASVAVEAEAATQDTKQKKPRAKKAG